MSINSIINPLVAGGCHSTVNKDTTVVLPYVVVHEITGVPVNTIGGYGGITPVHYQVDVFAASKEQAKGLAKGTIRQAMEVAGNALVFCLDGQYDETTKTHQYITEYLVWES